MSHSSARIILGVFLTQAALLWAASRALNPLELAAHTEPLAATTLAAGGLFCLAAYRRSLLLQAVALCLHLMACWDWVIWGSAGQSALPPLTWTLVVVMALSGGLLSNRGVEYSLDEFDNEGEPLKLRESSRVTTQLLLETGSGQVLVQPLP